MSELVPHPLRRLAARLLREVDAGGAVLDLPGRKRVAGDARFDTSVSFHGLRASSPLGPAAGPQSQLAQNIVLAFLGGGRIFELKTVQILDELEIPRPCIDMRTVGYNVEWSQELKLDQSLGEYVKASMLVRMLVESGQLALAQGFDDMLYDMSVGYDLAGIQSEQVQTFMGGMMDASAHIDALRPEMPAPYRDLDFQTELSRTLTLSTFHGCPPDEIEKIINWLLEEHRLHCVVKLNPTLLGKRRARELLNDALGYPDQIPDSAFESDTQWQQAVDFVGRLREKARSLDLGFGVKLTNTLIVENDRGFFPDSEKQMYLSGRPLHVLAIELVSRFRETLGADLPISFSAGVDKDNFADAVALGLVPVTVCSDLLKTGGYGRMQGYFKNLYARMEQVDASTVDELIMRSAEGTDNIDAAKLKSTQRYLDQVLADPRYHHEQNHKAPKKVGTALVLFDCLTCDKCVPVCPNDANFTFILPQGQFPQVKVRTHGGKLTAEPFGTLAITKKHQIGNFADFCNECGHCDGYCPEDGGPYAIKPRFFGTRAQWEAHDTRDGFFVERGQGEDLILGRFDGTSFELRLENGKAAFTGAGFALRFDPSSVEDTLEGEATDEVDLTFFHIMRAIGQAVLAGGEANYLHD